MDVGLVCDACSALTPIGVPQCTRCGAAVALDPRPRPATRPQPIEVAGSGAVAVTASERESIACSKCGTLVGPNQRFCPQCGARIVAPVNFEGIETRVGPRASAVHPVAMPNGPSTGGPGAAGTGKDDLLTTVARDKTRDSKPGRNTLFFGGAMQAARAKLTLIRGDGDDGVSFTLAGQDHFAGRGDCPISFPDDPFLSPIHANFAYAGNQLVVRDQQSLNGVYVRISGKSELLTGSMVLVGEQVLSVDPAAQPEDLPDADGTYYSASMIRPATLEIRQNLRGGHIGWVHRVDGDVVTIGRENNDINFPDDPFISGRHAELRISNGVLSVTDLGSRNGTFVRVQGERVLKHGDYVFLGQQLLRVEIV
ncbi:MAG TPA: FHA domain-containing protein [Kofleriaceae bacterium]|nr:FHA domain-containing protein [Kofleriaceae bacterium]